MDRTPVNSTSIVSVGYDQAAMLLEVEYTGGSVYQYFDVPQAHFDGVLQAASAGNYVNTQIKPNYRYAPV